MREALGRRALGEDVRERTTLRTRLCSSARKHSDRLKLAGSGAAQWAGPHSQAAGARAGQGVEGGADQAGRTARPESDGGIDL